MFTKTLHIRNIKGKFLYQESTFSHELEKEWKNPNLTVNIKFLKQLSDMEIFQGSAFNRMSQRWT